MLISQLVICLVCTGEDEGVKGLPFKYQDEEQRRKYRK
jgi:hypothetical protein